MRRLRTLLWLVQSNQLSGLAALVRPLLHSDERGVGLRRGIEPPLEPRRPRYPLTVRPIDPQEQAAFTDPSGVEGQGVLLRLKARQLFEAGLETCYVAVTEDNVPVYIQYLVLPDQNDKLAEVFGGQIPQLTEDEALLEFAFTLDQYRALGVMPYAFAELAAEARRRGADRLVTWVSESNPNMLRYLERIGFVPFSIRTERYRLFRRTIRFEPVRPESRRTPGA